MPKVKPDVGQTLNASAFAQLRADILTCQLLPNERLRMETLRQRMEWAEARSGRR